MSQDAATVIAEGQQAILAKMRADRPTLREYLRQHQTIQARSSEQWKKAGDEVNSAFRSGMWNALRDVERMLERDGFAPE